MRPCWSGLVAPAPASLSRCLTSSPSPSLLSKSSTMRSLATSTTNLAAAETSSKLLLVIIPELRKVGRLRSSKQFGKHESFVVVKGTQPNFVRFI